MDYEHQAPVTSGRHANLKKKKYPWPLVIIGVIVILVVVGFIVVRGQKDSKTTVTVTPTPADVTDETVDNITPMASYSSYAFDIPSLIGKNIDDIRGLLKADIADEKEDYEPDETGVDEWENNFVKDGKELLITFNPTTRKVIDFFIFTDDSTITVNDKNKQILLKIGNVKTNASNYTIEFATEEMDGDNELSGLQIVPK